MYINMFRGLAYGSTSEGVVYGDTEGLELRVQDFSCGFVIQGLAVQGSRGSCV